MHRLARSATDANEIRASLNGGANPNASNQFSQTPLHIAAQYNGNLDVTRAFLDAGADPNIPGWFDKTPLHLAVRHNGNADVIRVLLDAGADPRAVAGERPLTVAAEYNGNPVVT